MKIGIYGGSFSPIHLGHLLLAENCRDHLQLDEVWLVPASISPLKQEAVMPSDAHRIAMMELAIAGNPHFRISHIELERGGVSYTVNTLNSIKAQHQSDDLYLLIGGDSLANLHKWKSIGEICKLATLCFVHRPDSRTEDLSHLHDLLDAEQIQSIVDHHVPMPHIGISSSDIRERISAGKSIRYLVPRSVEKYIETQRVFRHLIENPSS